MPTLVVHCRKSPYDVYIGRPSFWGNPFVLQPNASLKERRAGIAKYEEWIKGQPEFITLAKLELKGKILGCYCAPLPCHGDILARIANE